MPAPGFARPCPRLGPSAVPRAKASPLRAAPPCLRLSRRPCVSPPGHLRCAMPVSDAAVLNAVSLPGRRRARLPPGEPRAEWREGRVSCSLSRSRFELDQFACQLLGEFLARGSGEMPEILGSIDV